MVLADNKLFKELDKLINKKHANNYIVDIGASFNSHFLKYNCSGVLFDMDESKIIKIPSDNLYKKIHKKITPGNVLSTLKKYNVPYNFLALNLDIDSYDLFVLIKVLKRYSPKIIITEINEKIPLPVSFSVRYHKDWYWKKDHFFGYSISCLEPVLKRFGYYIHSLVYNNVILIKGNRNINIEREYKRGYLLADRRKGVFPWNNNVEYWQTLNAESLKKEIKKYCKKYKGSFAIGKVCENLIKTHL